MANALASYANMLPMMRPWLPDCPDELIFQSLHWAGREFCMESEAFLYLDSDDLVADQKVYPLTIPAYSEMIRVRRVLIETASHLVSGTDPDAICNTSYFVRLVTLPEVEFFNVPVATDNITTTEATPRTGQMHWQIVLAPTENAAGNSDQDYAGTSVFSSMDSTQGVAFLNRWGTYIRDGALAFLHSHKSKPFYDAGQAAIRGASFRKGILYARRDEHIQYTSQPLTMSANSFLGGGKGARVDINKGFDVL